MEKKEELNAPKLNGRKKNDCAISHGAKSRDRTLSPGVSSLSSRTSPSQRPLSLNSLATTRRHGKSPNLCSPSLRHLNFRIPYVISGLGSSLSRLSHSLAQNLEHLSLISRLSRLLNQNRFLSLTISLALRAQSHLPFSSPFSLALPLNKLTSMATKYIIGSMVAATVVAFSLDHLIADKKIFGGTTPKTVASSEWLEETDKKFQAWPRTAGPPVVMNPISRQNFIVKSHTDS
ncbi:Monopolar spindle 2 [Cinnamomum micranthum f. kanehirae]|uniref:Monopolar spindle 2 n=1 Tax=Cinnamomum micranthum f. kanehirae TaxID=337451 RepID=A0A3S3LWP9_9MAGN|nr:Monopolar spindle 2 [Cinnamomum micranthum f. kanehirae]